jgi:hypothetical protein
MPDNFDLYGLTDEEMALEAQLWGELEPGIDYSLEREDREWLEPDPWLLDEDFDE